MVHNSQFTVHAYLPGHCYLRSFRSRIISVPDNFVHELCQIMDDSAMENVFQWSEATENYVPGHFGHG